MVNQTVTISRELLERLIDPYAPDCQSHVEARAALSVSNQPAGEVPEVVGVRVISDGFGSYIADSAMGIGAALPGEVREPLMTVAQCDRIVARLLAEIGRLKESLEVAKTDELNAAVWEETDKLRHELWDAQSQHNRIVTRLQARAADPDKMADRFISWKLPDSVRPDACAMNPEYPHRYGTNLLTWAQAKEMFEYVLGVIGKEGA